ncbi:MAG: ABC transporter ATP-binding protein/permease [Oscillospiraceae bacterium]|nr:ABC transporter ATP-binding protein/permease [Oscillospiraceae bacterium]
MPEPRKADTTLNFRGGPGRGGPGRFAQGEKPQNAGKTMLRLVKSFSPEKPLICLLLAVVAVGCGCSVAAPGFQAAAIDQIKAGTYDQLPRFLLLMLGAYLLYGGCTLAQGLAAARLSQRIVKRMRGDLFRKVVNLPVKYLDSHPHGDVMSRMTNDVENISNIISQSISSLVSGVLMIIGTVGMMIWYCWQLALLSCATVILTLLVTKLLSGVMRKLSRTRQRLLGELNGLVEEKVTSYRTVTAYNQQDAAVREFQETSDRLCSTGIWADSIGGSMGPLMNCISNTGFVIIAAFGGYFSIHGMISVGVISAFIIYAKQFSRPINELANLYAQIQTAIAGAERVYALMDEPDEDKSGERGMEGSTGVVSFRKVNFSYVPGKQVLRGFNLEVRTGQKVALVGATGSGKTTVVNLLMRFYDIDSGEILIDGVNIRDIDARELRRNTAIVLQDTVLFSDTIRGNLKYANQEASDGEMERAARMSSCAGMIARLPEGYDTVLSEGGGNLSQGQRQLLSICRAFLANPKILILDEATSSVDTRTERAIQNAMHMVMQNRTSFIIAHRLSTIRDADLIVVMDHGEVVERGSHEALLARKGKYYDLYMTQYAGFAT